MEKIFSPETKESMPLPAVLDLVIVDGRLMQCIEADPAYGADFIPLDDNSKIFRLTIQVLEQYEFIKPTHDMTIAGDLVEKGLMTEEQLARVHWGPEENKNPELKRIVTFFGTYTK